MDAGERWLELTRLSDDQIALDEAALLIAAQARPTLDVATQLAHLDQIGEEVGGPDVDQLCRVLFGTLGLRGDHASYDDPRNSYLDQVLERRMGIPISLSVLLIEVGRRCGLRLEGVGMPGHFLVRDPAAPAVLIDAFAGGRRLDYADCEQLLRSVLGPSASLTPMMLAASSRWSILARMLANLDQSFHRRQDFSSLRWVTRLRVSIPGLSVSQRLELADRLTELGCYDEAADVLVAVATQSGVSPEASSQLRSRAASLRAQLN